MTSARKLLRQFGTIDGVLAAASSGQLKHWGRNVTSALSDKRAEATAQLLRRNEQIFGFCINEALLQLAAEVGGETRQRLQQYSRNQLSKSTARESAPHAAAAVRGEHRQWSDVAWLHPDNVLRWRGVRPQASALSAALQRLQVPHVMQHVLPSGLAVDIALHRSIAGSSTSRYSISATEISAPMTGAQTPLSPETMVDGSTSPLGAVTSHPASRFPSVGIAVMLIAPEPATGSSVEGADTDDECPAVLGGGVRLEGRSKLQRTWLRRAGWQVVPVSSGDGFDADSIALSLSTALTALQ